MNEKKPTTVVPLSIAMEVNTAMSATLRTTQNVLLQAIIQLGDKTSAGTLIRAVAHPTSSIVSAQRLNDVNC